MADVLIDKFRVKVVRQGTTPANPGNVTTDPLSPVNPPGTGDVPPISFLQLTDTPTTYVSQALKVVRVNAVETGLEFTTINVLGTVLTGYTVGSNTALAATDTILQAFGKVQGQINARVSGTATSGQVAFGTGVNTLGGDVGFTYDSANDRFTIGGASLFGNNNIDFISSPTSQIYATSNTGVAEPFQVLGNLVIAPRTNASLSTYFVTNNGSNINWRWRIISSGILESRESNSIVTRTGNLNIRSDAGNGSIIISPNGTGGVTIGPSTTPTNTLDVNGTARIRTVSNATGNFVTLSATGVLQHRTAAEVATDIGAIVETNQTVSTSGTINNLVTTATNIIFTGTTVTLTGIVALADNKEINIINRTGSVMTLPYLSASSTVGNRFFFLSSLEPNGVLQIKYSSTQTSWILKTGNFFATNSLGYFTNNQIGVFMTPAGANIALAARNPSTSGWSLQLRNNANSLNVLTAGDTHVNMNQGAAGGGTNRTDTAFSSRPPSGTFGFSYLWDNQAGSNIGSIEKNGDIVSQRHFYFGAPNWFDAVPANTRGIIRGIGTGTDNTLLLEDSAGTDNAQFLDNGQILFLRLPTSSAGLAAGSLWNDAGTLKIV